LPQKQTKDVQNLSTDEVNNNRERPMSTEKKELITLEVVLSLCDEQAITAPFSPFMTNTSSTMLSDILRKAPYALIENV